MESGCSGVDCVIRGVTNTRGNVDGADGRVPCIRNWSGLRNGDAVREILVVGRLRDGCRLLPAISVLANWEGRGSYGWF